MDKKAVFNLMFDAGLNYEKYFEKSTMNVERMKVSYQESEKYLNDMSQESLKELDQPLKILCISEDWCGDCGNGVPAFGKLTEYMENWELRMVARDGFEEYVEKYYTTAGRKKIPVLIIADEDGDEIYRWIERPAKSYEVITKIKEKMLPKEEYITEYRSHPDLQVDSIVKNTLDEVIALIRKAVLLNSILPKKS